MNILLDTHIFLWWDRKEPALGEHARTAIETPLNQIFASAVSTWEIAIKRRFGKLIFPGSASAAIGANGFHALSIVVEDTELAGGLQWDHNDPFDRLLVAQGSRLGLVLLTADRAVRAYGDVPQLWAG